jgi:hypothetical protein
MTWELGGIRADLKETEYESLHGIQGAQAVLSIYSGIKEHT